MRAETSRSIYISWGKRTFDFITASIGLVLLLPLFFLVSLLSKLTSQGPVFYRQERVGRSGNTFKIIKFRTMQVGVGKYGPNVTATGDPRITSLGKCLRASKLDELPQLWNVFKGEMSLVGPRPEIPIYVKSYTEEQKKVLSVRPGITDPSSIAYRHEEDLLASHANPEIYYQKVVLPHKLSLNAEYIGNTTLKYDLALLSKTLFCLLSRHSGGTSGAVN